MKNNNLETNSKYGKLYQEKKKTYEWFPTIQTPQENISIFQRHKNKYLLCYLTPYYNTYPYNIQVLVSPTTTSFNIPLLWVIFGMCTKLKR